MDHEAEQVGRDQASPAEAPERRTYAYRMFRDFNAPERRHRGGLKCRVSPHCTDGFTGNHLAVRFVEALAERRAIKVKEILESFEFFVRVRRRVRAPLMADLCCGHGLTGIIFAMFDKQVQQVTLLDQALPPSHSVVLEAAVSVAPWVAAKITFVEGRVEDAAKLLAPDTSMLAVHACGGRTDLSIRAALALNGAIAMMPCCYHKTAQDAPPALRTALGPQLATDVHRTYVLERAGYSVHWTGVPPEITPMNRVMVATPG